MSNFMTLCEESVVDFETRVEQRIGTMEVLVPKVWMFQDFILVVDKRC